MSRHAARRRYRFHAKCRRWQNWLITAPYLRSPILSALRRLTPESMAIFHHPSRASLR